MGTEGVEARGGRLNSSRYICNVIVIIYIMLENDQMGVAGFGQYHELNSSESRFLCGGNDIEPYNKASRPHGRLYL